MYSIRRPYNPSGNNCCNDNCPHTQHQHLQQHHQHHHQQQQQKCEEVECLSRSSKRHYNSLTSHYNSLGPTLRHHDLCEQLPHHTRDDWKDLGRTTNNRPGYRRRACRNSLTRSSPGNARSLCSSQLLKNFGVMDRQGRPASLFARSRGISETPKQNYSKRSCKSSPGHDPLPLDIGSLRHTNPYQNEHTVPQPSLYHKGYPMLYMHPAERTILQIPIMSGDRPEEGREKVGMMPSSAVMRPGKPFRHWEKKQLEQHLQSRLRLAGKTFLFAIANDSLGIDLCCQIQALGGTVVQQHSSDSNVASVSNVYAVLTDLRPDSERRCWFVHYTDGATVHSVVRRYRQRCGSCVPHSGAWGSGRKLRRSKRRKKEESGGDEEGEEEEQGGGGRRRSPVSMAMISSALKVSQLPPSRGKEMLKAAQEQQQQQQQQQASSSTTSKPAPQLAPTPQTSTEPPPQRNLQGQPQTSTSEPKESPYQTLQRLMKRPGTKTFQTTPGRSSLKSTKNSTGGQVPEALSKLLTPEEYQACLYVGEQEREKIQRAEYAGVEVYDAVTFLEREVKAPFREVLSLREKLSERRVQMVYSRVTEDNKKIAIRIEHVNQCYRPIFRKFDKYPRDKLKLPSGLPPPPLLHYQHDPATFHHNDHNNTDHDLPRKNQDPEQKNMCSSITTVWSVKEQSHRTRLSKDNVVGEVLHQSDVPERNRDDKDVLVDPDRPTGNAGKVTISNTPQERVKLSGSNATKSKTINEEEEEERLRINDKSANKPDSADVPDDFQRPCTRSIAQKITEAAGVEKNEVAVKKSSRRRLFVDKQISKENVQNQPRCSLDQAGVSHQQQMACGRRNVDGAHAGKGKKNRQQWRRHHQRHKFASTVAKFRRREHKYCELCQHSYSGPLKDHVQLAEHLALSDTPELYRDLNELLSQFPSVETFIERNQKGQYNSSSDDKKARPQRTTTAVTNTTTTVRRRTRRSQRHQRGMLMSLLDMDAERARGEECWTKSTAVNGGNESTDMTQVTSCQVETMIIERTNPTSPASLTADDGPGAAKQCSGPVHLKESGDESDEDTEVVPSSENSRLILSQNSRSTCGDAEDEYHLPTETETVRNDDEGGDDTQRQSLSVYSHFHLHHSKYTHCNTEVTKRVPVGAKNVEDTETSSPSVVYSNIDFYHNQCNRDTHDDAKGQRRVLKEAKQVDYNIENDDLDERAYTTQKTLKSKVNPKTTNKLPLDASTQSQNEHTPEIRPSRRHPKVYRLEKASTSSSSPDTDSSARITTRSRARLGHNQDILAQHVKNTSSKNCNKNKPRISLQPRPLRPRGRSRSCQSGSHSVPGQAPTENTSALHMSFENDASLENPVAESDKDQVCAKNYRKARRSARLHRPVQTADTTYHMLHQSTERSVLSQQCPKTKHQPIVSSSSSSEESDAGIEKRTRSKVKQNVRSPQVVTRRSSSKLAAPLNPSCSDVGRRKFHKDVGKVNKAQTESNKTSKRDGVKPAAKETALQLDPAWRDKDRTAAGNVSASADKSDREIQKASKYLDRKSSAIHENTETQVSSRLHNMDKLMSREENTETTSGAIRNKRWRTTSQVSQDTNTSPNEKNVQSGRTARKRNDAQSLKDSESMERNKKRDPQNEKASDTVVKKRKRRGPTEIDRLHIQYVAGFSPPDDDQTTSKRRRRSATVRHDNRGAVESNEKNDLHTLKISDTAKEKKMHVHRRQSNRLRMLYTAGFSPLVDSQKTPQRTQNKATVGQDNREDWATASDCEEEEEDMSAISVGQNNNEAMKKTEESDLQNGKTSGSMEDRKKMQMRRRKFARLHVLYSARSSSSDDHQNSPKRRRSSATVRQGNRETVERNRENDIQNVKTSDSMEEKRKKQMRRKCRSEIDNLRIQYISGFSPPDDDQTIPKRRQSHATVRQLQEHREAVENNEVNNLQTVKPSDNREEKEVTQMSRRRSGRRHALYTAELLPPDNCQETSMRKRSNRIVMHVTDKTTDRNEKNDPQTVKVSDAMEEENQTQMLKRYQSETEPLGKLYVKGFSPLDDCQETSARRQSKVAFRQVNREDYATASDREEEDMSKTSLAVRHENHAAKERKAENDPQTVETSDAVEEQKTQMRRRRSDRLRVVYTATSKTKHNNAAVRQDNRQDCASASDRKEEEMSEMAVTVRQETRAAMERNQENDHKTVKTSDTTEDKEEAQRCRRPLETDSLRVLETAKFSLPDDWQETRKTKHNNEAVTQENGEDCATASDREEEDMSETSVTVGQENREATERIQENEPVKAKASDTIKEKKKMQMIEMRGRYQSDIDRLRVLPPANFSHPDDFQETSKTTQNNVIVRQDNGEDCATGNDRKDGDMSESSVTVRKENRKATGRNRKNDPQSMKTSDSMKEKMQMCNTAAFLSPDDWRETPKTRQSNATVRQGNREAVERNEENGRHNVKVLDSMEKKKKKQMRRKPSEIDRLRILYISGFSPPDDRQGTSKTTASGHEEEKCETFEPDKIEDTPVTGISSVNGEKQSVRNYRPGTFLSYHECSLPDHVVECLSLTSETDKMEGTLVAGISPLKDEQQSLRRSGRRRAVISYDEYSLPDHLVESLSEDECTQMPTTQQQTKRKKKHERKPKVQLQSVMSEKHERKPKVQLQSVMSEKHNMSPPINLSSGSQHNQYASNDQNEDKIGYRSRLHLAYNKESRVHQPPKISKERRKCYIRLMKELNAEAKAQSPERFSKRIKQLYNTEGDCAYNENSVSCDISPSSSCSNTALYGKNGSGEEQSQNQNQGKFIATSATRQKLEVTERQPQVPNSGKEIKLSRKVNCLQAIVSRIFPSSRRSPEERIEENMDNPQLIDQDQQSSQSGCFSTANMQGRYNHTKPKTTDTTVVEMESILKTDLNKRIKEWNRCSSRSSDTSQSDRVRSYRKKTWNLKEEDRRKVSDLADSFSSLCTIDSE